MFKKLLLTSALLVTFVSAHAQNSQPFGITGSITLPAASVTIQNNGSAVFSSAAATNVKSYVASKGANDLYLFPQVLLAYSIIFLAPTNAALSFVDNNSGKVLPFDTSDSIRFGLVDVAGTESKTVRSLAVTLTDTKIDSSPVLVFFSSPNGKAAWSSTTVGGKAGIPTNTVAPGYTNAFAKTTNATGPESFKNLSGNLSMVLSLSEALVDNVNTGTTTTGSGTFTVVYL